MNHNSLLSRSLGPASGNLGDTYPFLTTGPYMGYLAGLSFSGVPETTKQIRLSRFAVSGITANLQFWVDDKQYTSGNANRTRKLSQYHRLFFWQMAGNILVTAVVFEPASGASQGVLPPFTVTGDAVVDPACYLPFRKPNRLYSGVTVLSAGKDIELKAEVLPLPEEENAIGVSGFNLRRAKPVKVTVSRTSGVLSGGNVRAIAGVKPDFRGNIFIVSGDGSHQVIREVAAIDTDNNCIQLVPSTVKVDNTNSVCCDCEEYRDRYYEIAKLYETAEKLTQTYNDTYNRLMQFREVLYQKLKDASRLLQLRLASQEEIDEEEHVWKCYYSLICSNIFDTPHEHAEYQFWFEHEAITLSSLLVVAVPQGVKITPSEVKVLPGGKGFTVPPIVSPPMANKVVTLELTFRGVTDGKLPKWFSEPIEEEP